MTEIDRQIIVLFHQLTSDQKKEFIDLAKVLVGLENTTAQTCSSSEECGRSKILRSCKAPKQNEE